MEFFFNKHHVFYLVTLSQHITVIQVWDVKKENWQSHFPRSNLVWAGYPNILCYKHMECELKEQYDKFSTDSETHATITLAREWYRYALGRAPARDGLKDVSRRWILMAL